MKTNQRSLYFRSGPELRARVADPIGVAAIFLLGLAGCQAEPAPSEEEGMEVADWRTSIAAGDPLVRRHAVDAVLGTPGDDGASALERVMVADADPRVRERAVLAYGQLLGRGAVSLLKDSALSDPNPAVVAAAMGSLARIREEDPEPARGWLDVQFPKTFDVGQPFPVVVRFGSKETVPRARVELQLPRGLEPAPGSATSWSGEVVPRQDRELTFMAIANVRALRSGARVHLKLDYPEKLDVEVHRTRARVAVDGNTGRFEPQPLPTLRTP